MRRPVASTLIGALLLAGLTTTACSRAVVAPASPPSVVLIVLDTVRRDHVGPCAGDQARAATPQLDQLARRGATLCGMRTPGSWTLPVHASIFTGLPVLDHRADFHPGGIRIRGLEELGTLQPLAGDFETIAERAGRRGFETVLVSGNAVLIPALGLAQGFQRRVARSAYAYRPPRTTVAELEREIAQLEPRSPLFLVINLALAHAPYELPDDEPVDLHGGGDPHSSLLRAFSDGRLPPAERQRLIADVQRGYAFDVALADRELGKVLALLAAAGRLDSRAVLIVTSDHGELLGEGERFDHGRTIMDEVAEVFAIVVGPGVPSAARDDRPATSEEIFDWLDAALSGVGSAALAERIATRQPPAILWTVSLPDPTWLEYTAGRFGDRWEVGGRAREAAAAWWRALDGRTGGTTWGRDSARLLEAAGALGDRLTRPVPRAVGGAPPSTEEIEALRSLGYIL